jgi:hypothetical protein
MSTNPSTTSLQNATEDVIETVRTDGVESYRSPYIRTRLKNKESRLIGAIDLDLDLCASFLGPEGTITDLPQDGPPLPEAFVGSLNDDTATSFKTAYFHVDTGATCIVTDQTAELHCPVPNRAMCGTAAKGRLLAPLPHRFCLPPITPLLALSPPSSQPRWPRLPQLLRSHHHHLYGPLGPLFMVRHRRH